MRRNSKKQYLVLGLGRFGSSLARSLSSLGHEVLAADQDEELVDAIAPYVTQAVQLDATDEEALASLDVRSFDAAVVAIGSISDSTLVTVLCKEAGVPCVIAKAVDDLHAKVLQKVGADRVVFPERDMGARVARSLVTPSILDMMDLAQGYQLAEMVAPEAWCGKSLAQVNVRRHYGLSVLAIRRDGEFLASPGADVVFSHGDVLLVLGAEECLQQLNEG